MIRLAPHSLLGQVMLALALGLLAGQAISGALLYRAAEQRREAGLVHSIALQLVAAERREHFEQTGDADPHRLMHTMLRHDRDRQRFDSSRAARPIRMRIETTSRYPFVAGETRLPELERSVREILSGQELAPNAIVIIRRDAMRDPFVRSRPRMLARLEAEGRDVRPLIVAAMQETQGGNWHIARTLQPRPPREILRSILLQTAVTSLVLFFLLFLLIRRITRPLAQLTARLDHFTRNPDRAIAMDESGPQDVRRLIAAYNAMEARIAAMLDEKDVMLGAIGHDLKTPLSALRVRIESVPDESQRLRMAQSIEDITATLDDILSLARVGRTGNSPEMTDISALIAGVVEEFEDMDEPVELRAGKRVTAPVHLTWIRRAARNLISNALRYGKRAWVDVETGENGIVIRVEDEGPGIPEGQIAAMMEPFQRGEASRNRATGGAGLGLTLARAIAEQHGGSLVLSNRAEGGLRAEIRLPGHQQGSLAS